MKVHGNLERAQLEGLAADPAAGVNGRIWLNTTDAQAKIDTNGTLIRAFLVNDQKIIIGNSVTPADNVRFNRASVGTVQVVLGDDVTAEGSGATTLGKLGLVVETFTDAAKPATGNAGRIIYNSTFNALNLDNGTAWVAVGSGGGVGAFLSMYPKPGGGPIEGEAGNLAFWEFEDEAAETLVCLLKVPEGYQAGQQIKLAITVESDEAGSAELIMQSVTFLVRENTDSITSVTNSETDTAAYSPASVVARELVLDLTDASGDINSIAVTAGDLLRIELSKPTDASTNNIRLFQSLVEVRIT